MALSWERNVYSSMVSAVGYDEENKEMYVTFAKGKRAIYSGVPEELALQLANAPSVGNLLNAEVKPYYKFRYG